MSSHHVSPQRDEAGIAINAHSAGRLKGPEMAGIAVLRLKKDWLHGRIPFLEIRPYLS
jgi:hypothetical protein